MLDIDVSPLSLRYALKGALAHFTFVLLSEAHFLVFSSMLATCSASSVQGHAPTTLTTWSSLLSHTRIHPSTQISGLQKRRTRARNTCRCVDENVNKIITQREGVERRHAYTETNTTKANKTNKETTSNPNRTAKRTKQRNRDCRNTYKEGQTKTYQKENTQVQKQGDLCFCTFFSLSLPVSFFFLFDIVANNERSFLSFFIFFLLATHKPKQNEKADLNLVLPLHEKYALPRTTSIPPFPCLFLFLFLFSFFFFLFSWVLSSSSMTTSSTYSCIHT